MEHKVGDRVRLIVADEVDTEFGLEAGKTYQIGKVDESSLPYFLSGNGGWGWVAENQVVAIAAAIVHDHLIRDDNYQYWSLSDTGKLICVGSELEVEEDQNGYEGVADIQTAWNILVEDGYINEYD